LKILQKACSQSLDKFSKSWRRPGAIWTGFAGNGTDKKPENARFWEPASKGTFGGPITARSEFLLRQIISFRLGDATANENYDYFTTGFDLTREEPNFLSNKLLNTTAGEQDQVCFDLQKLYFYLWGPRIEGRDVHRHN